MANGAELATAWVRLVPTVEGIQDTITKEMGGGDLDKVGQAAGKKWSAGAKTAMTVGAAALTAGVVAIFNTGIEELKFGEQLNAQTDILVANTGFSMATDQINDYTLALSQVSGVSEEDLQAAGNNLLKFGGLSEEAYKQAVASVNDIASTGKEAAGVSEALGKALADPAAAAGVLKRQGVLLNDEQQALIDSMISVGDQAGAQQVILDALEGTYGGMAEASGDTLQGNLNKLNNSWENLAGSAVETLMPAIEGVVGMLQGFVTWISENEGLMPILIGGLGFLALAFVGVTVATWAMNTALLANPITWIILAVVALIAAVVLLVMNWDNVVKWITEIWSGFINWITGVIDGFVTWWNNIWTMVGAIIADIWQRYIVAPIEAAVNWIVNTVQLAILGFQTVWESVWKGIGSFVRDIWNNIVGWIEGGVNGAIDLINGFTGGIRDVAGAVFGVEIGAIAHVSMPRLAEGATIMPRRGGTAAILAEAGRPESVVDTGLMNRALEEGLDGARSGGDTYVLEGITTREAAEEIAEAIDKKKRRKTRPVLATVGVP